MSGAPKTFGEQVSQAALSLIDDAVVSDSGRQMAREIVGNILSPEMLCDDAIITCVAALGCKCMLMPGEITAPQIKAQFDSLWLEMCEEMPK